MRKLTINLESITELDNHSDKECGPLTWEEAETKVKFGVLVLLSRVFWVELHILPVTALSAPPVRHATIWND